MFQLPVIGIPCSSRIIEEVSGLLFHVSPVSCSNAITHLSGCFPILLPAIGDTLTKDPLLPEDIVDGLDGLLLPGCPSNIDPWYYGEAPIPERYTVDALRDSTTLPIIRQAVKRHVPILGICRGHQELNVALGGKLYQDIETQHPTDITHYKYIPDLNDSPFANTHDVKLTEVGLLYNIAQRAHEKEKIRYKNKVHKEFNGIVPVSSVHYQAVKEVAEGVFVEARSKDGIIEATSVSYTDTFTVGVQWHPEQLWKNNMFYRQLFKAFGDAARKRHKMRKSQKHGDAGLIGMPAVR